MGAWLRSRGVQYLVVLAVILGLNFALPRALPGGPLAALGGEDVGELSSAEREAILATYGLDRPVGEQFAGYLRDLLTGDLGTSFVDRRPVAEVVLEALPWTLLLIGTATLLTSAIGVGLGVLSATRRRHGSGNAVVVGALVVDSLPAFWVGMLLIVGFGVTLGWLPTFGATQPGGTAAGLDGALDVARHMVLPVTALVLAGVAQLTLVTRSSMVSVLGSDFLQHQQARGIPTARRNRHALGNALLPIHTVLLLELGWIVGGSLVVETVFAYPGLGRLTFAAIQARDFPVMQGTFLLLSLAVLAMNLLADLTYPFLDPRLRRRAHA